MCNSPVSMDEVAKFWGGQNRKFQFSVTRAQFYGAQHAASRCHQLHFQVRYAIIKYLNSTQPKSYSSACAKTIHTFYNCRCFLGQSYKFFSATNIFWKVFTEHLCTGGKPGLQHACAFANQQTEAEAANAES